MKSIKLSIAAASLILIILTVVNLTMKDEFVKIFSRGAPVYPGKK